MNFGPPLTYIHTYIHACKIWSFHCGNYEVCHLRLWCLVAAVRTDVSEELIASIITVLQLLWRFFPPWLRRQCVPPKRRFLQESHSVTSHNTAFFIHTSTSESTLLYCFGDVGLVSVRVIPRSCWLVVWLPFTPWRRIFREASVFLCQLHNVSFTIHYSCLQCQEVAAVLLQSPCFQLCTKTLPYTVALSAAPLSAWMMQLEFAAYVIPRRVAR
jgi:hypothetical protein